MEQNRNSPKFAVFHIKHSKKKNMNACIWLPAVCLPFRGHFFASYNVELFIEKDI